MSDYSFLHRALGQFSQLDSSLWFLLGVLMEDDARAGGFRRLLRGAQTPDR